MITKEIDFKRSLTAIGFFLVFSTATVAQSPKYDKEVFDLLANYPKSDGLDYVAYSHAGRDRLNDLHFAFYSTWFLHGNPRVAMVTTMTSEGEVHSVRSVFNWADQAGRWSQLTTDDLRLLMATIEELPKAAESPPLEFVVVVSFQQKGKWLTRLYDRRNPPPELTRIHKLANVIMYSN